MTELRKILVVADVTSEHRQLLSLGEQLASASGAQLIVTAVCFDAALASRRNYGRLNNPEQALDRRMATLSRDLAIACAEASDRMGRACEFDVCWSDDLAASVLATSRQWGPDLILMPRSAGHRRREVAVIRGSDCPVLLLPESADGKWLVKAAVDPAGAIGRAEGGRLLNWANLLASALRLPLQVTHVLPEQRAYAQAVADPRHSPEQVVEADQQAFHAFLAEQGFPAESAQWRYGSTVSQLLEAQDGITPMLVIGWHQRDWFLRLLGEGTAEWVLHDSRIAMMVLPLPMTPATAVQADGPAVSAAP